MLRGYFPRCGFISYHTFTKVVVGAVAFTTNRDHHPFAMEYRKHYLPLESNPELFTELIHLLGVSKDLALYDVLSLEDEELLAFAPRPALALVLVFPTSEAYEKRKAEDERVLTEHTKTGDEEPIMWFKQTINNACGLYGILHAISNGAARGHMGMATS
jgi:ubiquitin carboxyl-terminal hydrolase L3